MRVTCVTPRYLPNVRHLVRLIEVDVAIILDLAKMPHRNRESFVNRNRILNRSSGREQWLTVPVRRREAATIGETMVDTSDMRWSERHIRAIEVSYPEGDNCAPDLSRALAAGLESSNPSLLSVNLTTLQILLGRLRFAAPTILLESQLVGRHTQADHRSTLTRMVGGTTYVAGTVELELLKDSGELRLFEAAGVRVVSGMNPEATDPDFDEFRYLSAVHSFLTRGDAQLNRDVERIREVGLDVVVGGCT